MIKDYILQLKTARKALRTQGNVVKMEEDVTKDKYFTFLYDEMTSQMNNLEAEITKSPIDISDDKLFPEKYGSSEIQKRLDIIWGKLSVMMQLNTKNVEMVEINERYQTLI